MKLIVLKNNVPLNEVSVETSDLNEKYEIYVGRSEDCHVQIDDPLISRHHLVLKNEETRWYCEKLTQLGAVVLNGAVVSKNEIHNGDEVKCGVYSIFVSDLPVLNKAPANETLVYKAPVTESFVVKEEEPGIKPIEDASADVSSLEDNFEDALDNQEASSSSVEDNLSINDVEDPSLGENSSDGMLENSDFTSNENEFGDAGETSFENSNDEFGLAAMDSDESNTDHESTRFFKAFVSYQLVLFGEHAPYDRYQIDEDEIFIGRDSKKCQIVLNDPEVSSVHAVIHKNNTDITLEDLNSSNGTILNGERINKAPIATGDEFVIGGTSFTLEVRSDLLDSEADRLMPVESGQVIETEEIEEEAVEMGEGEISFDADAPIEKSIIKRIWKNPAQRKKAIYGLLGVVLAWALLSDNEPTDVPVEQTKVATEKVVDKNAKPKRVLSKELVNRRNVAYELGVSFFEQNKYFEALREFQTVAEIDPEYKKIQTYLEQTKVGLKRLEELEAEKRAEEERIKTKKIIEELLVKARQAVKDRSVPLAESYFTQIVEKDPENIEVQQLKLELESWQKEEQRKALAQAAKEAARKKMVDALAPGKTYYLKKEWYRSILKLEEFLRSKGMDEDLVKEASEMLSDARNQLSSELGPLLGKARSLKEGQDYKNAYEAFLEILKVEPTNSEALNEADDIKSQLDARSRRIYREAIIAESLSLFNDAKEKFQEVQQISPTDSEYYKKATEKLKNYLE